MCVLADYAHCQMSLADWFTMVHPSGGIRYEMIDQDVPGSWVVDPASHRANYSGRIMEDHVDTLGHLTGGALRRCSVSFNLPPGVHCGPGVGAPPPPLSSDDEDPSEEEPVGVHSSESSTPTVAIIDDHGSGPKPVSPAPERIAVARGGRIVFVDLVVLDSDSDDDHAST